MECLMAKKTKNKHLHFGDPGKTSNTNSNPKVSATPHALWSNHPKDGRMGLEFHLETH